jgi:hypothetical protein
MSSRVQRIWTLNQKRSKIVDLRVRLHQVWCDKCDVVKNVVKENSFRRRMIGVHKRERKLRHAVKIIGFEVSWSTAENLLIALEKNRIKQKVEINITKL